MKVFQGMERFEATSEGSFRNWVSRCVECEIKDRARSHRADKRGGGNVRRFGDVDSAILSSSIFGGREPRPSELALGRELGEQIEAALITMPEDHREVIILRNICGMTYAEIQQTMGFHSEGSARLAFSRALRELDNLLPLG